MGVKYSSSESSLLIEAMNSNIEIANEITDRLSSGSDHLISALDSGELQGATYTAGKNLFSEIIIPSIKKLQSAVDDIQTELTSYKNADAVISGFGELDLDDLKIQKETRENQLAEVKSQIRENEKLISLIGALGTGNLGDHLSKNNSFHELEYQLQMGIDELKDKIEKLEWFVLQVSQYFSDSLEVLSLAIQGATQLSKIIVDSNGNYYVDGVDMAWFDKMREQKIETHFLEENTPVTQVEKDKKKIVNDLMSSYNLDEATANVLYKLQQGILKKAKQQGWSNYRVIYEYNRLIASYVPDNFVALRYKAIAGVVETEERDNLSNEYGLSSDEIALLKIKLPEQHNDSTSYKDFAHEAIQLATFTEESWDFDLKSLLHIVSEVGNSRVNIPELNISIPFPMEKYEISFKGDVDSGRYGDTDFNSDLDPINSYELMKVANQKDIFRVQADYNRDIESNKVNRVEEFYKNIGYGDKEVGKAVVRFIVEDGKTAGHTYITWGQSNEEKKKNQKAFFDYLERGGKINVR